MSTTKSTWVRLAGVAAGSAALALAGSGPASAHVTVTSESAAAGSTAVLAFSMSHGCDGSATRKVAIKIPAGIDSATPTINTGWTVDKITQKLPTPLVDQHGNKRTERVDQVVYSAKTPLADGYRDVLTVSVPLPEDGAGKTFAFPVVQTCEKGETAWVDLAADGQDPHELEAPAPTITATAAEAAGHHAEPADPEEGAVPQGAGGTAAVTTTSNTPGLGWSLAGLASGLAGLAMGAVALARGRQTSK
jgi:uncharacterized protein YcnI